MARTLESPGVGAVSVARRYLLLSFFTAVIGLGTIAYTFSPTPPPGGTPRAAADRRAWWRHPTATPDDGRPLALLDSPPLLNELFPGQPATLARDSELWTKYFSRAFNADTRLPSAGAERDELVSTSWLGCLDVFERYGALNLILGNSETMRAVIPAALSARLGGESVLACTRSAMLPDSLVATAQRLAAFGRPRAKRAVFGYSLWWAYPEEAAKVQVAAGQAEEISRYDRSRAPFWRRWWLFSGEDWVAPLSWGRWFPYTIEAARIDGEKRALAAQPLRSGEFRQDPGAKETRFHAADLPRLERGEVRPLPYYRLVPGAKPPRCTALARARTELRRMVDSLLPLAEHVYVYLTPITPLAQENYSPCFAAFARDALAEIRSDRVHTRVGGMAEYALSWSDFVIPTPRPPIVQTDLNHLNFRGAKKVSAALAQWMAGAP